MVNRPDYQRKVRVAENCGKIGISGNASSIPKMPGVPQIASNSCKTGISKQGKYYLGA